MTEEPRRRHWSNTSWPEVVIMILRVLSQVNAILYDWLRDGPGGPYR